jgi:hypothetical protein
MTVVAQADLVNAVSVDELSALGANPTLSDLLMYVRDGSQATENAKHRKVGLDVLRTLLNLDSSLSVIAGTNEAVTMIPNRHYELNGSILTANRIYNLDTPLGIGDRQRVSLTNGNSSFSAIIQGVAGVTINGGTAATEWSRLHNAREYVEFLATSLTNWDVWDDGRIGSDGYCGLAANTGSAILSAYTVAPMDTSLKDSGGMVDLANDRLNIRRAGTYTIYGSAAVATGSSFAQPFQMFLIAVQGANSTALGSKTDDDDLNSTKGVLGTGVADLVVGTINLQLYQYNPGLGSPTFRGLVGATFLRVKEMIN